MTIEETKEIRATVLPTEQEYFDAHSVEMVDAMLAAVDYIKQVAFPERIKKLRSEARQEAAREIIELMGGWSLQNSTLITCRGIVARHFGLEG